MSDESEPMTFGSVLDAYEQKDRAKDSKIERLAFHLESLLAMPAACVSDEEVTENVRRRELARSAISWT